MTRNGLLAPTSYAGVSADYPSPGLLWLPSVQEFPIIGPGFFTSGAAIRAPRSLGLAATFSPGNVITADYSPLSPSGGANDDFPHTLILVCSMSSLAWQTAIVPVSGTGGGRIQVFSATNAGLLSLANISNLYTARRNEVLNVVVSARGFSDRTVVAINGKILHSAVSSKDTRVAPMYIGRRQVSDSENWTGPVYMLAILPTALNEGKTQWLSRDCFALLRKPKMAWAAFSVGAAVTAPTLTAAIAHNLGSTTVTPRVTFTR